MKKNCLVIYIESEERKLRASYVHDDCILYSYDEAQVHAIRLKAKSPDTRYFIFELKDEVVPLQSIELKLKPIDNLN